ncbi:hypothetical protein MASR2M78_02030 [Treponema sp.]
MEKQGTQNVLLNRIVSFLAGGLLVFAVMSFTTVSRMKEENKALNATLDISRYEAGRLLSDAKAEYASRDFDKAKESLETLFANQPGSSEAQEGRVLLVDIDKEVKSADLKWDNASIAIQKKWTSDRMTELRNESDMERAKLEAGLTDRLNKEWEEAKNKIRSDWEEKI